MTAPTAATPWMPGDVVVTYRVRALPTTCRDHVLLWACEQLVDERCSGEVRWPPPGYGMARYLYVAAERWMKTQHRHTKRCAVCRDCHPEVEQP